MVARIAAQHAVRGDRGRIPRTALRLVDARDPRRHARQAVHVGGGGADVLRRQVPATELVDGATERVEQLRRPGSVGIVPPHDGLAAALVEPGDRRLQRHRLREPQHVVERVGVGLVVTEAHPAERRPERGRVDGDDGAEPGVGVGDEHDLLVTVAGHEVGDGTTAHGRHQAPLITVTVASGARSVPWPPTRYPRRPMTTAAPSDTGAGSVPTLVVARGLRVEPQDLVAELRVVDVPAEQEDLAAQHHRARVRQRRGQRADGVDGAGGDVETLHGVRVDAGRGVADAAEEVDRLPDDRERRVAHRHRQRADLGERGAVRGREHVGHDPRAVVPTEQVRRRADARGDVVRTRSRHGADHGGRTRVRHRLHVRGPVLARATTAEHQDAGAGAHPGRVVHGFGERARSDARRPSQDRR